VLSSAVDAGYVWLAVAAVLLSLVGAFYYLRIVKLMYFDEPKEASGLAQGSTMFRFLLSANGAALLLIGILPQALMHLCLTAIQAL
jgi:NADH-quinone oxidoreductase subunit N